MDLTEVSALVGLGIEDFIVGQTTPKTTSSKIVKNEKTCSDNQDAFISYTYDTFDFITLEAVHLLERLININVVFHTSMSII